MDLPLPLDPVPLISKEQIANKISEVAKQIDSDYTGRDLVIVMVLKGAICVGSDLVRAINVPCTIESLQCSSYGALGAKRGELCVFGLDRIDLKDRDVLLVDDIFDSGYTLSTLAKEISKKEPRSLKSLVLLKKNVPHVDFSPDYVLFDIENNFVVGYGLDYKEYYRGLDGVYTFQIEPN